jgi:signal transduction histidine kinase
MFRISPPVLHDLGLVAALQWLTEEMQRDYGLAVSVSEHGQRVPLDETVRSVVFRCVRELLVNVAKHAKVKKAELSVSRADGRLSVSVRDAGVGFDPAQVAQVKGQRFGLISVRERIGFVDGTFAIDAVPGDGTVATLSVPLPDARGGGRKRDRAPA